MTDTGLIKDFERAIIKMPKEIWVNTFEWKEGKPQHRNGRHNKKPNGNFRTERRLLVMA